MTDEERLSLLLDDELPADEADALRTRIATEPRLAEAWALMQALPGAVSALPLPTASPQTRARALDRLPRQPVALRELAGWLIAAAALLTHLIPTGPSTSAIAPLEPVAVDEAIATDRGVVPQAPLFALELEPDPPPRAPIRPPPEAPLPGFDETRALRRQLLDR